MKKIIISILGLSILGLANASEQTGELKSSAMIESTCLISTDSINFGVVATPLMQQTANSEMNILCNNSTPYTIDLSYGGIYGQGSSDSGYLMTYMGSYVTLGGNNNAYIVYTSDYQREIGSFHCIYNGVNAGKTYFSNISIANLYNSNVSGITTSNACSNNVPTGWTGNYNASTWQSVSGGGYTYGIMGGASKGDKLAYAISVPGDNNKVWNAGANSYKGTGSGLNQVIPLNAKIVPDKSGSKYPAPDMYSDTVTAVISY